MRHILILLIFSIVAEESLALGKCMNTSDFKDSSICKESKVIKKVVGGKTFNAIHTKLGAIIDASDVDDEQELVDTFLKFDSWDEFARREGSNTVKFRASRKLPSIFENGEEILRHYSHFGTKAPPPVFRQWVRTVISYWKIPSPNNSLAAYRFLSDKKVNKIDGEDILVGSEGMRHYEGILIIFYDSETSEYIVYTEFWLIPTIYIDKILEFAIPSIERGLVALVKGMFEL